MTMRRFTLWTLLTLVLALTALMLGDRPTSAQALSRLPIICPNSSKVDFASATTTQIVGLTAAQRIFVCGFSFSIQGNATTANTFKFRYGTGTNCATAPADVTGPYQGTTTAGSPTQVPGTSLILPSAQALCGTTTQASAVGGVVSWVKLGT